MAEEDLLGAATRLEIKRIISWQIHHAMKAEGITKSALAKQMTTRRSPLNRLLNDDDTGLTLETMTKAAQALGRRVRADIAP